MAFQAVDTANQSITNEANCRTDTGNSNATGSSTQSDTGSSNGTTNNSKSSSSSSSRSSSVIRSSSQSGSKIQTEKDDIGCVIRFRVPVVVQFPGDP